MHLLALELAAIFMGGTVPITGQFNLSRKISKACVLAVLQAMIKAKGLCRETSLATSAKRASNCLGSLSP